MLHQMTWPPQSPDLNPIEMGLDELDRRVKEKQPTSAQHMWELLQDCWKSIRGEAGMPRVCIAVINAKGGYLKNIKHVDLFLIFLGYYMIPYVLFHCLCLHYYSTM